MRASRISSRTIQITARMRAGWPWRLGKPRLHGCPCVPKLASCWLIRRWRFIGRRTYRHDSQILARLTSGDGVARTTGKGCTWKQFLLGGRSAPPVEGPANAHEHPDHGNNGPAKQKWGWNTGAVRIRGSYSWLMHIQKKSKDPSKGMLL